MRPVIDLHSHSSASDGTDSPAQLVRAAAAAGVDVLAVTDHDTALGWADAQTEAERVGIEIVPGIEVSCTDDGRSVHLLGYHLDPEHPELVAELAKARTSRETRLERMVELMIEDGIPISWAEVTAQIGPGATPGRPHIADALVASGVVGHRDEAFARMLGTDSPYYVHHYAIPAVRGVEVVRAAGGVAVIAHPFAVSRGHRHEERLIEEMAAAGMAGIEVDHRDHDEADRRRLRELAAGLGLLVTGSRDYHGTGKHNRLAEHTTEPKVLEAIRGLVGG